MFGFFKKKAKKPSKAEAPLAGPPVADTLPEEKNDATDQYIADQPIASKSEDKFNRAPFATRIAETLATRVDPSSIVVGLYGPWGDGKTSVLEMVQEELKTYREIIVVRFNPWHFQTEDLLLRGFFATLADAMGKSLPNMKEKAGTLLQKYGSVLSLASLSIGSVVQVSPGEAAKGLGDAMSNVGLDELRFRIESMLDEAKKRLVILIDDIDRLDRDETHAVFKLVKLSASFRHTAYVLAFDDAVVSAALGERYGAGGASAGRAFLEKIIQVPLHLPPVDENSLRHLALEGVDKAVNHAEISLTQPQVDAFIRHFDDALLPSIDTPRRAKLLSNALLFALPILRGEVNPVDLMLIEGIRVIYPDLYAAIRDNQALFLQGEREARHNLRQDAVSRIDTLIRQATLTLSDDERAVVRSRLLEPLFPRLGSMGYGGEWDSIWAGEQKVCSTQYFKRYFTYSVPVGDVPDSHVAALCESVAQASSAERRALLDAFAVRQGLPRLVARLRQREATMTVEQATALIETFAVNGDLLPRERGMMVLADTRAKTGMLIAGLLRQIQSPEDRQVHAERAIRTAMPVGFAMECIRWIRNYEDTPPDRRVLADEGEAPLRAILTSRIEQANVEAPLYASHPKDARSLYWAWVHGTSQEHVREQLVATFDEHPEELDSFLACYVGEAWGMESGLPRPADFQREEYDSVTNILPGEYIAANIRQRYGSELDTPQEYPPETMMQPRRVAHQFMRIHLYVLQHPTEADLATTDGDSSQER
ncbi:KAP family P-loop NTPase fold protein [Alcaligenes faecalis]|uniref:KAP family P-loop NTPase fold protein n=1 Tax=Alcaligenes faecalis TaxID=511 RepID=UPI001C9A84F9|nr:P-loop NTPase fold protein [Alcaligenes faecalis]MBY6308309.1 NTPase KAP [Alcaligenes faecalis]MBY6317782.1 NTPase KAP [Alcaligenes faecalis]MBY6391864.1 NTPase KAP [Alcaligenes faecalis]